MVSAKQRNGFTSTILKHLKDSQQLILSQVFFVHYVYLFRLSNSSTKVTAGVGDGDGDGTVPLISLGYMPVKGWIDNPTLNPSGIKIVTKECMLFVFKFYLLICR